MPPFSASSHEPCPPDAQDTGGPDLPGGLTVRVVGFVEAILGVCVTTFVLIIAVDVFVGVVLLEAWVTNHPKIESRTWNCLLSGWLIAVALTPITLGPLFRAVGDAESPVLLFICGRWLRTNALLRPFVSLWWLLLALAAPLVADSVVHELQFFRPSTGELLLKAVMPAIVVFAGSVAANCNLLIAAAALTGSPTVVRFVWRFRLLIDLIICCFAYYIHVPAFDLNTMSFSTLGAR